MSIICRVTEKKNFIELSNLKISFYFQLNFVDTIIVRLIVRESHRTLLMYILINYCVMNLKVVG